MYGINDNSNLSSSQENQDYYLHRFAVNGKSHGLSPPKKIHW